MDLGILAKVVASIITIVIAIFGYYRFRDGGRVDATEEEIIEKMDDILRYSNE